MKCAIVGRYLHFLKFCVKHAMKKYYYGSSQVTCFSCKFKQHHNYNDNLYLYLPLRRVNNFTTKKKS